MGLEILKYVIWAIIGFFVVWVASRIFWTTGIVTFVNSLKKQQDNKKGE